MCVCVCVCVCKKTHRGGRIGPPTSVGGPIREDSVGTKLLVLTLLDSVICRIGIIEPEILMYIVTRRTGMHA